MNRPTALKVLRNFGHLLLDVTILYNTWMAANSSDLKFLFDIEWYLAEYYSKSVEKITFIGMKADQTTALKSATELQLPKITTLHMGYCHLAKKFSINANFPNLQSLSLHFLVCNFNIKDWHFPTVKHLYFSYGGHMPYYEEAYKEAYEINEIDLVEMLKRIPQLEQLELQINRDFLSYVGKCLNEYFPKLHCLSLILVEPLSFESVHLENITDFSLFVRDTVIRPENINIPFTFNRLECFRLCNERNIERWKNGSFSDAAISHFVSQNEYIKSIEVYCVDVSVVIQLFQLENVLSNVEMLCICAYDDVPSDAVDGFLTQNRSLKLLKICGIDGMSDTIKSKISDKKMHKRCNGNIKSELIFGKTGGITSTNTFFPSVYYYNGFEQNTHHM